MNFSNQMKAMMGKQLKALSELYGFDMEEAKRQMDLQEKSDELLEKEVEKVKVEKVKKEGKGKEKEGKKEGKGNGKGNGKKVELPFLGEKEEGCEGVVPSGGLYLQCCKEMKSNNLCAACVKQGEKNGTGEPDNGRIDRRLESELYEYRTPKGKKCTRYVKVMEEKGWTREEVEEEARRQGKVIPEEHFEEESKGKGKEKGKVKEVKKEKVKEEVKRGRPKEKAKEVEIQVVEKLSAEEKTTRDAELQEDKYLEEDEEELPKKKKKEEKKEEKKEKKTKKAKMVVEDEEEGEQEVVCDEYVHTDGKKYYRCADTGILYTAFGVEVRL